MGEEHFDLKLIATERCHPDQPSSDSCTYCKKQGMPILIARYAVRGKAVSSFMPIMPANDKVAQAMPWDLRPKRTIDVQRLDTTGEGDNSQIIEVFDPVTLPSFAEYILRRPRKGYIYVYDEIYGGQWRGYYIDHKGYIKSEKLGEPTSLLDTDEFSCNSNPDNVALGSIITLPNPNISRVVYLTYVEAPWSAEWREKIAKDENWRKSHMQSFTMSAQCSGPDIYPIDQLEKLVFEYSSDILMFRYDSSNTLLKTISNTIKGQHSISEHTKKTLIKQAADNHYPTPFIFALHDDVGITLHLNELRVAQQLMIQDQQQNPEEKRRRLCITSIMSLEESICTSPYARVTYDPSKDEKVTLSTEEWQEKHGISKINAGEITYGTPQSNIVADLWEKISPTSLTEKKPIPKDFRVDGIAGGKTYEQCLQADRQQREDDKKFAHEHVFLNAMSHNSGNNGAPTANLTEAGKLESYWDDQYQAQEQLVKEFYSDKYFLYKSYYQQKEKMLAEGKRIKEISERLDIDYCWWLENRLSNALECYDDTDINHRAVALSLLERALTGGIIAQSSRNLWKKFYYNPHKYSLVIKGVLGWSDELAKNIQEYLSQDTSGPITNKRKPKTLFEEYYIKEIGKTIKKVNSLYKDRKKLAEKDFSSKALSALKKMHEDAQSIADTIESTHKSIMGSEYYISLNGTTKENRESAQRNIDNNANVAGIASEEFHSSGLKVTQFKMLRIMHAHRMMCMDIVAHVQSLETINNQIISQSEQLSKLEAAYSRISQQLFTINNIDRHIIFLERPITDFFDDITRQKAEKLSSQIKEIKSNPIVIDQPNTDPAATNESNKNKTIKSNTPDIHTYSNATIDQPIIYNDNNAATIEEAVNKLSPIEDFSEHTTSAARIDKEIERARYNKILREQYSHSMRGDLRDRWVGRLSRLAIYWGFIESFKTLCTKPGDLKAWWKMSNSVVFVTQSYFDVWEQAAKQRNFYLKGAAKAEETLYGAVSENLIVGSKIASNEMQFAKLWSKRIGLVGSSMSIIDGLCDISHAHYMSRHGELEDDVTITKIKGCLGVLSGIIGIILIETVFIGGFIALFAFAIALWLLPSTETLMPLGVRNWLRRSLLKRPDDNARYLPFKNWEEEQAAFKTIFKGIEVDTDIAYHSNINLNPDPPCYTMTFNITAPSSVATEVEYYLDFMQNYSFVNIFSCKVKPVDISHNKYEIEEKINLPSRFKRPSYEGLLNPHLDVQTHTIKLIIYINLCRKPKLFKKGHLHDHLEKDQLRFTIKDANMDIIDRYSFDLEW